MFGDFAVARFHLLRRRLKRWRLQLIGPSFFWPFSFSLSLALVWFGCCLLSWHPSFPHPQVQRKKEKEREQTPEIDRRSRLQHNSSSSSSAAFSLFHSMHSLELSLSQQPPTRTNKACDRKSASQIRWFYLSTTAYIHK